MPSGWIYSQHDRGLYIVQAGQKEKREGDIRLWRLFKLDTQNARAQTTVCGDNFSANCNDINCRYDCYAGFIELNVSTDR